MDCQARGPCTVNEIDHGIGLQKLQLRRLREASVSCFPTVQVSQRGMSRWKRFLGPKLGCSSHERVVGSGEGRRCNGVRAAKGNRRATV
jgi:hypothetical protein